MLSVVIPARNEPYLQNTITSILEASEGDIEVIAVLEGYWPVPMIKDDPRVHIIHYTPPKGMRGAINAGVSIAKGEYILKCDAHVLFSKGFDKVLTSQCENNWVVVPRRFALDVVNWKIEDNPKYPVDYMFLNSELHGEIWHEKNKDKSLEEKLIDDLMSSQGSCWMMTKTYFESLELMDEDAYGSFASEFQEIGLKAWLSGGEVKVNKSAWYAHWHKTESRGYSLSKNEFEKGAEYTETWRENGWNKQTKPFSWLIEKFWPVPSWPEDRTLWKIKKI